jgi:DNA-binding PadR family transcriptional regulator
MSPRADDAHAALRTTDLFVLAVLTDGPQHGYALAQQILERSGGHVAVRPGDLYRVLYRMEIAGLLEAVPATSRPAGDERRTYYRMTPLGRKVARDQARMLSNVCAAMLRRPRKAAVNP